MNENLSLIYSAIDATKKAISDGDKTRRKSAVGNYAIVLKKNLLRIKRKTILQNYAGCS